MNRVPWLYGRRRAVPAAVVAALLGCYSILVARTSFGSVLWAVYVVAAVAVAWRCWTQPMPPGYAERVERAKAAKREFGRKLWHKFAIAFLALLGTFLVVVWTIAALS